MLLALAMAGLVLPLRAHTSFLPPQMMDSAAMGLAWFIIVAVTIGGFAAVAFPLKYGETGVMTFVVSPAWTTRGTWAPTSGRWPRR